MTLIGETTASEDLIKDGSDATFMADVIEASKTTPVLVDFWATWCGPCIAEIPNMVEQYEKYHAKGFEVVGISLDEDKEKVDSFVAENKIPWPIIYAGKGWQDPIAQFYGISGIPQLILIGRDGNVITLNARGAKLAERLAELFKDAG